MSDINNIFISGRIGTDPKIKYFESGAVTCELSVGVGRWNKKKEAEDTTWINCKVWGKKAEYVGEYVKKGDYAFISGSLKKDIYEDSAGRKCANSYILVEEIKTQKKQEKQNP